MSFDKEPEEVTFADIPNIEQNTKTEFDTSKVELDEGKLEHVGLDEIEKIKLQLKQWGYDHQKEYKAFIRVEYQRVFNLKRLSKKKGKYISVVMFALIGYGLYELLVLFAGIPLPSFIR